MTESPQPGTQSGGEPADKADTAALERAVDIALIHFAQEGYAATKLDMIAREAGMSKRMLHYHFGDKRELYRRALNRAAWSFIRPRNSWTVPTQSRSRASAASWTCCTTG